MVRRKSPDVDGKKAEAKHDEQPARDSYSYMFDVESDVELFSEKTSTESLINEARTTSQRKEKGVSRPKVGIHLDYFPFEVMIGYLFILAHS